MILPRCSFVLYNRARLYRDFNVSSCWKHKTCSSHLVFAPYLCVRRLGHSPKASLLGASPIYLEPSRLGLCPAYLEAARLGASQTWSKPDLEPAQPNCSQPDLEPATLVCPSRPILSRIDIGLWCDLVCCCLCPHTHHPAWMVCMLGDSALLRFCTWGSELWLVNS